MPKKKTPKAEQPKTIDPKDLTFEQRRVYVHSHLTHSTPTSLFEQLGVVRAIACDIEQQIGAIIQKQKA